MNPFGKESMAREQLRLQEDRALAAFCAAVSVLDSRPAVVLSRPDRDSPKGGCEAIVRRIGRDWAIEHTTFDCFPDQRLDSARLDALAPAIEVVGREFPGQRISISVPLGAVPVGKDWNALRDRFAEEVIRCLRAAPEQKGLWTFDLPGLFPVNVSMHPSVNRPGCYLGRYLSQETMAQQVGVIRSRLAGKRRQLESYHADGYPTALLLENDDIGLMDASSAAESFVTAAKNIDLSWLDEVYIVDGTYVPVPWLYPAKLGPRVYPLPEFEQFEAAQYRQTYGGG